MSNAFEKTLYRADCVLADARRPIRRGAVLIEAGRVAAVDAAGAFGEPSDAHIIDLAGLLMPGLVNAHAHLEYSWLRGRLPRAPFSDWLPAIIAEGGRAETEIVRRGIERAAEECLRGGMTLLGDVTTYGLAPGVLAGRGPRFVSFVEATGLHPPFDDRLDEVFARLEAARACGAAGVGVSPHAPYSVGLGLLERLGERFAASGTRPPLCVHVAESEAEAPCLAGRTGPLADLFRRREFYRPSPGENRLASSAEAFVEALPSRGESETPDLLVHGNFLSDAALGALARSGRYALAVCPGTRLWHGVAAPVAGRALAAGLPLALGTDSLASNDRLDMWEEMRRALAAEPDLTEERVLEAATAGGAFALGQGGACGALRPGMAADFLQITNEAACAPEFRAARLVRETRLEDVAGVWIGGERRDGGRLKEKSGVGL